MVGNWIWKRAVPVLILLALGMLNGKTIFLSLFLALLVLAFPVILAVTKFYLWKYIPPGKLS